jgi:hypothetical protein
LNSLFLSRINHFSPCRNLRGYHVVFVL